MVHIICLKHINEGMVRFQWCSGAHFSGVFVRRGRALLGEKQGAQARGMHAEKTTSYLYGYVALWNAGDTPPGEVGSIPTISTSPLIRQRY